MVGGMNMCFKDVINLLSDSIQIIGIFVAVIIGLVVSKILSIKEEQDTLKVKINDNNNNELEITKKQLIKVKEENYRYYKENTIDEIMCSVFSEGKEYDYLSDKTPFVENEYKKEFYVYIMEEALKRHIVPSKMRILD